MRVSLLAAVAALAAAPGSGAVISIGGSNAAQCYRAAEARRVFANDFLACDMALASEAIDAKNRAATLVNRGILYMVASQSARAVQDFDAAIGLYPSEPESYLNKAIVAWNGGDSIAARQLAGRALDLNTRKPAFALYVRGMANEDQGNLSAAYADLRRAAELAPAWRSPRLELARYRVTQR